MTSVKRYEEAWYDGGFAVILFSTITFTIIFLAFVFESEWLLWCGFLISLSMAGLYGGFILKFIWECSPYPGIPIWFQLRFVFPSMIHFIFTSFVVLCAIVLETISRQTFHPSISWLSLWTVGYQSICLVILLWMPDYTRLGEKEDTFKEPLLPDKDPGVETV